MLSIAFFSECYHPMRNGVVVSVASFARVLMEMGHEVTIFTARHPEQEGQEERVYRFPSITLPTRVRYPIAIPIATGEARRLLVDKHFDIIHSHSPMLVGHAAIAYHRRRNVPLIFTYHTLIEEYTHYIPLPQAWVRRRAIQISREYSNDADHVITPTDSVAQRLRRYRVIRPITVIPTGIDIDLMDQVPDGRIHESYNIPDGVPLIAYAGRIAREKNIPRVLSAFRQVLRREPDAHLLLIGGGPYESAVREMIDDLGIGPRTRLTGYVPREIVTQGLRAADIFAFASCTETQGLVIGEAMACSIPVVAVAADAPRELMDSGVEGLLVDDNTDAFADALLQMIDNPGQREEMGRNARVRAESISAHRCTERLLEVYDWVLSGHRNKHRSTRERFTRLLLPFNRRRLRQERQRQRAQS
jgi:glycosyltransferase involved in cell wall biosynthesis